MSKSKRIVHLIHTLDPGGCEHMLLSLLPHLQKEGWDVTLITLGQSGVLAPRFEAVGIRVYSRIFRSPLDLAGFTRLKKLLQTLQPGLIAAHLLYADALVRILRGTLFGIPALPVIHSTYNSPGLWHAKLFEFLTTPLVQKVIAVSPIVRDMAIKRGLKEANIFLVPNPVDTATFFPAIPNVKQSLRKTLGLSPSSFVITCVANFIDYKRHIDLVQAFKIALETNPAIELCLVGQGKEEATIRAWVAKETLDTKIHVLGQRQDVPDILRASDCFVLPSLFEGMSVAIMEAMASGLPVIASDIPENRVLINNRVSGVLVPANNPPVLATTLTELINCDPVIRNDLGNQARQHIENNYSLSAITRYWESVYTAVAKT